MADQDVKSYDYGSRVRHNVRIESNDSPTDPSVISIFFTNPQGGREGPFIPSKRGRGQYFYERTYTSATPSAMYGTWESIWIGTGSAEGARIRRFIINSSRL